VETRQILGVLPRPGAEPGAAGPTGRAGPRDRWWGSGRLGRLHGLLLGRYTAAMTTTDIPAADPSTPPGGLSAEDLLRIEAAAGAACAASTRHVYAAQWRLWERWCAARDLTPLPADPATVGAYLAARAADGIAVVSLNLACSAIGHAHRARQLPDPVQHQTVRQVRRGLARTYGTAPRRQARPLDVAELRQILRHIDRDRPSGVRDTAIILLGYAGALRRSELAGLHLADVEHKTAGLLLTLRRSKTDPDARGHQIGIAHGHRPTTDPVGALNAWLALRGREPGPLFTRVFSSRIHATGLHGETISRMIHTRAQAAGLPAERITAHSLRAGHATTAALAGVPLERIAAQTRHKDLTVLVERYIRPLEALAQTSSKDLGL